MFKIGDKIDNSTIISIKNILVYTSNRKVYDSRSGEKMSKVQDSYYGYCFESNKGELFNDNGEYLWP